MLEAFLNCMSVAEPQWLNSQGCVWRTENCHPSTGFFLIDIHASISSVYVSYPRIYTFFLQNSHTIAKNK